MAYDGKATCGGCTATWTGLAVAHCAGCHRSFSRARGFDRHRRGGSCVDPSTVGMALSDGVWRGRPMDGGSAHWHHRPTLAEQS